METEQRILEILRTLYKSHTSPKMDPSNEPWPTTPQQLRKEVDRYGKDPS